MNITYSLHTHVSVFLGNKLVGLIQMEKDEKNRPVGYRYYPRNSKTGGELFPTLEECKKSIEEA